MCGKFRVYLTQLPDEKPTDSETVSADGLKIITDQNLAGVPFASRAAVI